jgi:hypothetical protein
MRFICGPEYGISREQGGAQDYDLVMLRRHAFLLDTISWPIAGNKKPPWQEAGPWRLE